MRCKIAGEMIHFRGGQAPKLVAMLKTLTARKRIDEGFPTWDAFVAWQRQFGHYRGKAE